MYDDYKQQQAETHKINKYKPIKLDTFVEKSFFFWFSLFFIKGHF